MTQSKKCPSCGTHLDEEELDGGFCPDCGEDLESGEENLDDEDDD